jgi:long-subunit acyl-CoA synthetase (AMP-forming)
VLKHRTVVAAVGALSIYLEEAKLEVDHRDSVLSFLPLAHIFGRVVEEFIISRGAKIGYWQVCWGSSLGLCLSIFPCFLLWQGDLDYAVCLF